MRGPRRFCRWWLATATAAAVSLGAPGVGAAPAPATIAEARSLYAAAAYEETLALIATVDDPALADQVDEYRTLCLLALNREPEAARIMESIVRRHPLELADIEARSPKFATLYRGVQARLTPTLAADSYAVAKRAFDAHEYGAAAKGFTHVLALLRVANGSTGDTTAPLELLASGFLALAERRAADPAPVPIEPAHLAHRGGSGLSALVADIPLEAAPAVQMRPPAPVLDPPPFTPIARVYTADDRDVTPPVAIEQRVPLWRPPTRALRSETRFGRLEILIDVDGRVVDAEILQPAHVVYDDQLLRMVNQWRYQPATKRGYPVQYRKTVEYALRPPAEVAGP